jgi:hypothetical protein
MEREFLVQLTSNLYRLTLLFPKKEPLRYKIREAADDILAHPSEKDIETLSRFLEVALDQNWVSPSDILAIKLAYDNLKSSLSEEKPGKKIGSLGSEPVEEGFQQSVEGYLHQPVAVTAGHLVERHEKILDFLKENGRAQVWQIKQILSDVSKRTLRRDFEHLLKQGTIERIGERNNTFYQLKTIQS